MALNGDELTRLMLAVSLNMPIEQIGLPQTDEVADLYFKLLEEIDEAPEGTYISPPFEWDDGRYNSIIDATYKAWGEPRTLEEMNAPSLVSKAVDERKFTLGPMYIPNKLDAHDEWTDANELQSAVWEYVRKGDRRIRLQHDRDIVAGEWVEIMTFPYPMTVPVVKGDTREEVTFPKDTVFLGVVWEDWAWQLVKSGKLRGYSIGGKAERLFAEIDEIEKGEPSVNTVHVDTIMGGDKPKKKKTE